jgi:hypothetical protein
MCGPLFMVDVPIITTCHDKDYDQPGPAMTMTTIQDNQPRDLKSYLLSKKMEDYEMDEAETVAAAAFNAQQEIDDLENSTTISDDRNGMSSDSYCTIGEQEIHKSRYLNMLLAADGQGFHASSSKKSFDRLKRVAGEAKFNVAKESSVQRAAELAADHVRKWTEDIQTMDSDGEDDEFWCKDDPVALILGLSLHRPHYLAKRCLHPDDYLAKMTFSKEDN